MSKKLSKRKMRELIETVLFNAPNSSIAAGRVAVVFEQQSKVRIAAEVSDVLSRVQLWVEYNERSLGDMGKLIRAISRIRREYNG